jgi:hypothetical protein
MSYSACSNSALLAPDAYLYGAIGSIITPTILETTVASNVTTAVFTNIVLPKGVWLLTGTLEVEGAGGNITSSQISCLVDGVNQGGLLSNYPAEVKQGIPVCYNVVSDGTSVISFNIKCITSAGNWKVFAESANTLLKLVRVA